MARHDERPAGFRTEVSWTRARTTTAVVLASAALLVVMSCRTERLGIRVYAFCTDGSQCASGESCVLVDGVQLTDGGVQTKICSMPCSIEPNASFVYATADAMTPICVAVAPDGTVDTNVRSGSGSTLYVCGRNHVANEVGYPVACMPFDLAGNPIDLWVPTY